MNFITQAPDREYQVYALLT